MFSDEQQNLIEYIYDAQVPYTAPTAQDTPYKNSIYKYTIPGLF